MVAQSLASLHLHLIFGTKNRAAILTDWIREELHAYMATTLASLDCHAMVINSMDDHVHVLFDLGRTVAVSHVVEGLKKGTSKWIKTKGVAFAPVAWQAGYAAFAVSESNVRAVREYIANQNEHHRTKTFQEEYVLFLKRHGVAFDDRYLWD